MFDFSRTAVHIPAHFQEAISLKDGGAECLDTYVSVSALPRTMSRARVVHNQPFFIGVAGEQTHAMLRMVVFDCCVMDTSF